MSGLDYYHRVRYRRWTKGSIECYQRGCNCSQCPMAGTLEHTDCHMKEAVLSLVSMYGTPPDNSWFYFDGLTEKENDIVLAIMSGAETPEEVAEFTEMQVNTVKVKCTQIYKYIEMLGYTFQEPRKKFKELVGYLRTLPPKVRVETNVIEEIEK